MDDKITLALGDLAFAFGPGTLAAIVRRTADSTDDSILWVGTTTGSTRYALRIASSGALQLQCSAFLAAAPTITTTVADGWVLVAATKATGTVAPRMHKYVFGTGVWTHENSGTTLANSGVVTGSSYLGGASGVIPFPGDIGIAGGGSAVLGDAAIEALVESEAAWLAAGFAAVGDRSGVGCG